VKSIKDVRNKRLQDSAISVESTRNRGRECKELVMSINISMQKVQDDSKESPINAQNFEGIYISMCVGAKTCPKGAKLRSGKALGLFFKPVGNSIILVGVDCSLLPGLERPERWDAFCQRCLEIRKGILESMYPNLIHSSSM
jgi:hypothetical protein